MGHDQKEHQKVRITINGTDDETHQGNNTVEHLRQLGKIPTDEVLGELKKDHHWVGLDDKASIEIHGGEVFVSYHKDRAIHYTVDGEPQETRSHELTAAHILKAAGKDPVTHYLILLKEHGQESFEGRPDAIIHMHNGMKFIAPSSKPTPVS